MREQRNGVLVSIVVIHLVAVRGGTTDKRVRWWLATPGLFIETCVNCLLQYQCYAVFDMQTVDNLHASVWSWAEIAAPHFRGGTTSSRSVSFLTINSTSARFCWIA